MTCSESSPVRIIIAGFGLPGRALAEMLAARGVAHCVIELNRATVDRCAKIGTPIIEGDCRDPDVLRRAGIATASVFVVAVPDEKAAVESARQARLLNSSIHILTRCHYTSTGIEAKARGSDDVIVAEQVVAAEMTQRIAAQLDSL